MKTYKYKVKGAEYEVVINDVEGNIAKVEVNGIAFEVEMDRPMSQIQAPVKPVVRPVAPVAQPVVQMSAPTAAAAPAGGGTAVHAPLPGTVNAITVKVGDVVKPGQTVIVLEAMKMENNIGAVCEGKITNICVNQGDSVREGAVLLTIG